MILYLYIVFEPYICSQKIDYIHSCRYEERYSKVIKSISISSCHLYESISGINYDNRADYHCCNGGDKIEHGKLPEDHPVHLLPLHSQLLQHIVPEPVLSRIS